ncbi:hypothetical protein CYY_002596 [Polysphondylium violaceum]|uniref:4-hydroxybenzoate polyprenyltransferase, mitochondrial n=1 Tax=Polysphondylium violaceum TaxID=133409 RepID=A0A8J4V6Q9_9MYCE|nr:hypothetical protein CYY_002596 [Polysphondylium violaceum]
MFKGINRFNDRRISKCLYKNIINNHSSHSSPILLSSIKSFTSLPSYLSQSTSTSPSTPLIHLNSKSFCLNNNNNNNNNIITLNSNSNNKLPIQYNNLYIKRVYSTTTSNTTTNSNDQNNTATILPNEVKDWISKAPLSIQPYLRLGRVDKPIGTWLLLYPCLWSIAIATPIGSFPDPMVLAVFATGAFVMRSAGCVINDMADYKFDSKVERTKTRPIASNILNHKQSLIFLGAQLLGSLAMTLATLNTYTILLCTASLPIVTLYPFMKRFTYYPQFVLGLAFNWGAFAGFSAIQGYCDWNIVLPLYLAGISWTMVYDTIYAHQDKKDDILVGVKSTALKFLEKSRLILSGFSILTIAGMIGTGVAAGMPSIFYVGTGVCAAHLAWQLSTVDFDNPKSCMKKFISNKNFGLLFLLTIILSKLIQWFDQIEKEKNEKEQQQQIKNE